MAIWPSWFIGLGGDFFEEIMGGEDFVTKKGGEDFL